MWCTRWYLPLVLLPFPIAPPYFLWLFLFSTTLHARPCFYCIVMLSAMFMSSCYWPPVPLHTPLSRPWSANVTTFHDALHELIPDLPPELAPESVPMLDRCWCDLTRGSFFEPYNVTEWERNSVLRLKDGLEQKMRQLQAANATEIESESEPEAGAAAEAVDPEEQEQVDAGLSEDPTPRHDRLHALASVWESFWLFSREPQAELNDTTPSDPAPESPSFDGAIPDLTHVNSLPLPIPEPTVQNEPPPSVRVIPPPPKKLPVSKREYDLRPYGFALTLDFGWSHS